MVEANRVIFLSFYKNFKIYVFFSEDASLALSHHTNLLSMFNFNVPLLIFRFFTLHMSQFHQEYSCCMFFYGLLHCIFIVRLSKIWHAIEQNDE